MASPPRGKRTKSIPITGLSIFIAEMKPTLELSHPQLTKMDIFKLLHEQWDELDPEIRAKYEKRADYGRRTEARRQFYQKKKLKTEEDDNSSKISPYSVFLKMRHMEIKETNPDLTLTERVKSIAAEWNAMSRVDRLPFVNLAKRETRKIRKPPSDEDQPSSDRSSG